MNGAGREGRSGQAQAGRQPRRRPRSRPTRRTPAAASSRCPSASTTPTAPTSAASSTRQGRQGQPRLPDHSRPTATTSFATTRRRWTSRPSRRARRSSPAPSSAASATSHGLAPHLNFAIQPAGRGAPKIDPKPILDGWKLLEATAIYRAAGKNPFADQPASARSCSPRRRSCSARSWPTRASRSTPAVATTSRPARSIAGSWRCMEYLAARGYRLTITALKCGHCIMTTSGNVSEHYDRRRHRHRGRQRHPDRRQPGAGHAHRGR